MQQTHTPKSSKGQDLYVGLAPVAWERGDRVFLIADPEMHGTVAELNAAVPGMVRVSWDNPNAVKPAHHRLTWYAATALDWWWFNAPEVK
jgi:hypothetical protein